MTDVLRALDPLVGRWEVVAPDGTGDVLAELTADWLDDAFLRLRSDAGPAEFPSATMIVGADDTTGGFTVCYSDSRGVRRVYQMSLADGVWRQWRDVPGFAQRFTGTFSPDGRTIAATWELCRDGTTWNEDFSLRYRRAG